MSQRHPSVSMGGGSGAKCPVALFAVLLVVLPLVGCTGDEPEPSPSSAGEFKLMDAPQEDADVFPSSGPDLMEGMDPATTRSLGTAGDADYWVARNKDDELCFLTTFLASNSEMLMATCADEDGFLYNGLSSLTKTHVEEEGRLRSEAYLLPDDVDAEPLNDRLAEYLVPLEAPEGLTADRSIMQEEINFFPVGPGTHGLPNIELDRSSGEPYTFRTLG